MEREEALEELEEGGGATVTAGAEVHWDEASAGGDGSGEELETTEGEENVELDGNSSHDWWCSLTNDKIGDPFKRVMRPAKQPTVWSQEKTQHLM